ncbi:hypothetical protein JP0136_11400 [Helicobacter pylori]
MSGLKTFSCIVVLCGAMANTAIAGPKIEARGELGKFWGGAVGAGMGGAMGGMIGVSWRSVEYCVWCRHWWWNRGIFWS